MERAEEIFSLFEGQCPTLDCGLKASAISAGGTKEFQSMQPWATDLPEFFSWAVNRSDDTIGTVNFECPNEHQHTVDFGQFGDWS